MKRDKSFGNREIFRVANAKNEDGELQKIIITVSEGSQDKSKSKSKNKNSVTLVPMKSLSFENFSFPFSNSNKIRDALKLQVMPYSPAGELELFPVVISKNGRSSEGLVWYVSPEELNIPTGLYSNENTIIWPAALGLISQLEYTDGNGVTMYADEENICSFLWQDNRPVLSRWKKFINNNSCDDELDWYDNYCKSQNLERGGEFVIKFPDAEGNNYDLSEIINQSVKICPWLADVNLSKSVLEGAKGLERNINFLTKVLLWILGIGIIFLSGGIINYIQVQEQAQNLKTRSEKFYRDNFDKEYKGRISNPVTFARNKIAELTGTGTAGHGLDEVLEDFGEVFNENNFNNITIDTVRFNPEGFDCTGSAPDMTTILNFRKSWEARANLSQIDNTQSVPGTGYRFDLRVRW